MLKAPSPETLPDPEDRLIGITEVAQRLQCSERTVREMVADRRFIPGIKLSSQMIRWRFRDVAKWIDEQERSPPPPRKRKRRA